MTTPARAPGSWSPSRIEAKDGRNGCSWLIGPSPRRSRPVSWQWMISPESGGCCFPCCITSHLHFGAPRGIRTPTARSVAWCSASIWSAPDRSGLLRLDGSSIQTDPDRSRRIVWMINRMIKQAGNSTSHVGSSPRACVWCSFHRDFRFHVGVSALPACARACRHRSGRASYSSHTSSRPGQGNQCERPALREPAPHDPIQLLVEAAGHLLEPGPAADLTWRNVAEVEGLD
jgi:hypothetical protein